jgi:hypothetical protein
MDAQRGLESYLETIYTLFGVTMAVNHADGTMFVSVIFYPIAATKAALSVGAGWWALLFIPTGLAVGVAIAYVGRKLIYVMMRPVMESRRLKRSKGWVQWIVGGPVVLLYIMLPYAIVGAGI